MLEIAELGQALPLIVAHLTDVGVSVSPLVAEPVTLERVKEAVSGPALVTVASRGLLP
jgi:hypothetical protein